MAHFPQYACAQLNPWHHLRLIALHSLPPGPGSRGADSTRLRTHLSMDSVCDSHTPPTLRIGRAYSRCSLSTVVSLFRMCAAISFNPLSPAISPPFQEKLFSFIGLVISNFVPFISNSDVPRRYLLTSISIPSLSLLRCAATQCKIGRFLPVTVTGRLLA